MLSFHWLQMRTVAIIINELHADIYNNQLYYAIFKDSYGHFIDEDIYLHNSSFLSMVDTFQDIRGWLRLRNTIHFPYVQIF